MIPWILAAVAGVAFLLHEKLVRVPTPRPWLRRIALAVGIGGVAAWGAIARPHQSLLQWWHSTELKGGSPTFAGSGDSTLFQLSSTGGTSDPFPSEPDADGVSAWQQRVRQQIESALAMPLWPRESPAAVFNVTEVQTLGTVTRSFGWFAARDGTRIPAFKFVPVDGAAGAAILVVPGHGSGIAGTAGLLPDYQHAVALRLAEAGFVTLTPELRGFGYLGDPEGITHRYVANHALAAGGSYKSYVADDLRCALEVLRADPQVSAARIGVAGASLGAELSVLLAALDPTIKVICCHAHGGATGPFPGRRFVRSKIPHGCHVIPGINQIVAREDWFRLIAPRPLQILRGDAEPVSTRALRDVLAPLYTELGHPDRPNIGRGRGAHEFFVQEAIEFFRKNL